MEVETDAVPSPARQASGESEKGPAQTKEQDLGIPNSSPEPREQDKCYESTNVESPRLSSHSSTSNQKPPKSRKKPSASKNTTVNNVVISHSKDISFGNVYNFGSVHFGTQKMVNVYPINNNHQSEKPSKSKPTKRPKELKNLLNSRKEADENDLVIVSECVDEEGLKILSQELGIEEVKLNIIRADFAAKGLREVTYQTLMLWFNNARIGNDQSAMLNILCEKLSQILEHGGREALKGLQNRHFPPQIGQCL